MRSVLSCRVCGSTERTLTTGRCKPCMERTRRERAERHREIARAYAARKADEKRERRMGNLKPLFPTSPPNPARAPAPVPIPLDTERVCQGATPHAFDVTSMLLPYVCPTCNAPARHLGAGATLGARNRPSLHASVSVPPIPSR